jgi:hypothetical protein
MTKHAPRAVTFLCLLPGLALTQGCSDDVVCGNGPQETTPYISASILEGRSASEDRTEVEVFCSADPLPELLSVAVNDRVIDDVGPGDVPGLRARLEEASLVWQPGTRCSLRVGTEYGIATAAAYIPMPFHVSVPTSIALGETLTVRWRASAHADYYRASVILAAGTPDETEIALTVRDTVASFAPSSVTMPGEITGSVWATSGPFPGGGSEGNISGAGWGTFTAAYTDTSSAFRVTVTEPGR